MKTLICALAVFFTVSTAHAESVFRIEIGKDYKSYSNQDLQRRVWELERAVFQLQQRVFQLEVSKPTEAPADTWICSVTAMGTTYTGTAASKAVAKARALDSCKAGRNGDGFFCDKISCEQ